MAVDVVFSAKPDADYLAVSDDDFRGLLAAGLVDRYRQAGIVTTVGGAGSLATRTLSTEPAPTVDVVFSIQAAAGYVTVQRQDLALLLAAGLVLRYRDGGQETVVSGGSGAANLATAGIASGRGTLSANVTSTAGGATNYTAAGTVTGAGGTTGTSDAVGRATATGTVTGAGTTSGAVTTSTVPQGKGEQGGKGLGGKGGIGNTSAAVTGTGTVSGTAVSTGQPTPSGPVGAVDSARLDTSTVG